MLMIRDIVRRDYYHPNKLPTKDIKLPKDSIF